MAPIKEFNDAVYKIIGSCMEVHKILGPGLPLEFYKHALELEFPGRELTFETDKEVEVVFKDKLIGRMQVDFVVNSSVIIMVRSMENLRDIEIQQVLRAMRLLSLGMGILVNFGNTSVYCPVVARKNHARILCVLWDIEKWAEPAKKIHLHKKSN